MWPDKPISYIVLNNDNKGLHFGLFKNLTIISVVSLFINDNCAQFRKFATKTSEQGKGYGSILLNHIMTIVSNQKNINTLWCNARIDKTSFYERFGMTKTNKTFVKDGINYIVMKKTFAITN